MINFITKPFIWFFKLEAASGLVLLFAAVIALFISNSNFADLYFSTLNNYIFIGINEIGLKLTVIHWINDALMAIFFCLVLLILVLTSSDKYDNWDFPSRRKGNRE